MPKYTVYDQRMPEKKADIVRTPTGYRLELYQANLVFVGSVEADIAESAMQIAKNLKLSYAPVLQEQRQRK